MAIDDFLAVATGNAVKNSFLMHLANENEERWQKYRELREYYEGDHEVLLSSRQRRFLSIKANTNFSANYMQIVVDSLANRMIVNGFDAGDQSEILWEWWTRANMDMHQNNVHNAAIRDGDAYVLVSWNNETEMPEFTPQLAYDGRTGAHVFYSDETNKPEYGQKRWLIERGEDAGFKRRMNVYFDDMFIEFISRQDEYDGDWQEISRGDWPAGMMPMLHFKNRGRGFNYGMSEIEQGVPMQNALNKSVIALIAAADAGAFRTITWTGSEPPSGLEVAPGVIMYEKNPDAKIGWIPGENLRPMIETVDSFVQRIGQVTDTPLSYFQLSGQMASEGTHKQHEARMIAKARVASIAFGTSWEQCMMVARRLYNIYGPGGLDEEQQIKTLWDDFEVRDVEDNLTRKFERLEMASKAGANLEEAAKLAGFTDDQAVALAKVDLLYAQREPDTVE